jgi:hypothetical protein
MWGYDWVVSTGRWKERVMSEGVGTQSARVADLLEATGNAFVARAKAADTEPPIVCAPAAVVRDWVLVPRRHLKTIQSWNGEIDEVDAIMLLAEILADARLIGSTEA